MIGEPLKALLKYDKRVIAIGLPRWTWHYCVAHIGGRIDAGRDSERNSWGSGEAQA